MCEVWHGDSKSYGRVLPGGSPLDAVAGNCQKSLHGAVLRAEGGGEARLPAVTVGPQARDRPPEKLELGRAALGLRPP